MQRRRTETDVKKDSSSKCNIFLAKNRRAKSGMRENARVSNGKLGSQAMMAELVKGSKDMKRDIHSARPAFSMMGTYNSYWIRCMDR
jgi:hypothetical protein